MARTAGRSASPSAKPGDQATAKHGHLFVTKELRAISKTAGRKKARHPRGVADRELQTHYIPGDGFGECSSPGTTFTNASQRSQDGSVFKRSTTADSSG